jgi:ribulose-phosphate 3-epimerase
MRCSRLRHHCRVSARLRRLAAPPAAPLEAFVMSLRPIRVAPSLLAADFARLGEEVRAVAAAGADWLHLDIMDGHFVPNISYGPVVVKALRRQADIPFDVHLMIAPADPYLEAFAAAGADLISVHPEAGPHLHRTLQTIRGLGRKAGVVLNPATPVSAVENVLDLCDLILVMSVNPGFGGQSFLESQLGKIAILRQMIDSHVAQGGQEIDLQVDGGVTAQTAPRCIEAGADVLVAGTAVFGAPDYAKAIAAIRGKA